MCVLVKPPGPGTSLQVLERVAFHRSLYMLPGVVEKGYRRMLKWCLFASVLLLSACGVPFVPFI
jgi:hypothetical protein